MYVTTIKWGSNLDLLTIFDDGKLNTPELLAAIIAQNQDQIVQTYGTETFNDSGFRQHILTNTMFFNIKSYLTPVSNQVAQEYHVLWYTMDNVPQGFCHETILEINVLDDQINLNAIKSKIKATYPKAVQNSDGSDKDIFVAKYEKFKPS
jgi:hypothetical protein